jgi:Tol biopolymer transport system component
MKKKIVLILAASIPFAAGQTHRLSDYQQLTHGGQNAEAYWAPDGKRLIFQTTRPPYECDQIFVMNADGSGARQITSFGCASFAPTFTPDGKKILFASNKAECDSRKFELYLVNVDGTGLEQVTNFGGFTSFPEFSPDGKTLVFCSDKDAKERYEFNIFTAKWEK